MPNPSTLASDSPRLNKAWFESWFDSPYYEEIYDHRDLSEAKEFILQLTTTLALPINAQLLDLGCGWGRHTRSFAELGYTTTGLDLSPRLIAKAQENFIQPNNPISERMKFCIGDMRDFQLNTDFDAVVNLFTSFGYFDDKNQDLKVLGNAHRHLKENGLLVLDFFNKEFVLSQINESEYRCG
ncbi:MAG: SAM-dependent methyltransferase, partial [Bacteroidota bacterium]